MKSPREYVVDFHPPLERLETLLEKVQTDAYAEGVRDGSSQLFEIAKERVERGERKITDARTK